MILYEQEKGAEHGELQTCPLPASPTGSWYRPPPAAAPRTEVTTGRGGPGSSHGTAHPDTRARCAETPPCSGVCANPSRRRCQLPASPRRPQGSRPAEGGGGVGRAEAAGRRWEVAKRPGGSGAGGRRGPGGAPTPAVLTQPRLQAFPLSLRHVAGASRGPAPPAREPRDGGGAGMTPPHPAARAGKMAAPSAAGLGRWLWAWLPR